MRILLAAMLLALPLAGQELTLGAVAHHNSPADDWKVSYDAEFRSGHMIGGVVQFDSPKGWLAGSRAVLAKPFGVRVFLQDAIRYADQAHSKRFPDHPWILQTGIGVDGSKGPFRLLGVVSESSRLETPRPGYLASLTGFYRIVHNLDLRATYIQAHTPTGRTVPLANGSQIAAGFAYTIHFRK